MKDCGAIITTTESILFDMLRDSKHEHFKEISKNVKIRNEKENEFANLSHL